ncbi:MAG TPA: efflux transporter outer membrane subunit [Chlamydiales bacterium]|nr:efflux transporter outer membrane subunit [Chlamydiales bacterium]
MRRIVLLPLILLSSCMIGPKYMVPTTQVPTDWKGESNVAVTSANLENWWELFEDDTLNDLQKKVMEHNPSLYSALQRVSEARAVAGVAWSTLFPQANLDPSYSNTNELIKLYGIPSTIPGIPVLQRVHEMSYALPLNLSYEVDLWGRFRGTYKAAKIGIEAEDAAMRGSLLTLTTELASNYFNVRTLDMQLELLEKILAVYKALLELHQSRYLAGLDNYLDVAQAEEALANAEADYQDSVRQRNIFENAIATLIAVPSSEFHIARNPLRDPPPCVPGDLPSSILTRRPDIVQAERTMAAENALIGVAYTSLLPQVQLTTVLGFLSPVLRDFLNWKGRYLSWGTNIQQFIFDAGRRVSEIDAVIAAYKAQEGIYRNTILTAFQEVEDALTNIEQQMKQSEQLMISYTASEEVENLSRQRFDRGLVNLLEVYNYEETKLTNARNLMNVIGLRYQSSVQLIKALGGGWDSSLDSSSEEEGGACESDNCN